MLFATRPWNLTFPLRLLGNPSFFFLRWTVDFTGSEHWAPFIFLRVQPWQKVFKLLHCLCCTTTVPNCLTSLSKMIATVQWNDSHPGGGGWGTPSFGLNSNCGCTGYCFQALESLKKWSQGAISGLVFELPTIFFPKFHYVSLKHFFYSTCIILFAKGDESGHKISFQHFLITVTKWAILGFKQGMQGFQ